MKLRNLFMIIKENFRICLRKSLVLAFLIIVIIPFIFGVVNLNDRKVAECLEKLVVLIGIPLFVPILKPEQDQSIREAILIRGFPYRIIVAFRIIMAIILSTICIYIFELYMLYNNCSFPLCDYLLRTVIASMYIGGVGLVISAMTRNTLTGYLAAFLYYFFSQSNVAGLEITIVSDGLSIGYILTILFLYLISLFQCELKIV